MDEETKSFLNSASVQDEDAILSSPKGSTSSKSPETPIETGPTSAATQQKKVVLKRKLLTSVSLTESETPTVSGGSTESKIIKMSDSSTSSTAAAASLEASEKSAAGSNGSSDGNVVKLSQLSMKERLEMRAKKFGAPVTGDAAKLARAERFGTTSDEKPSVNRGALSAEKIAADVDLLKKRAERFGGSVSNTMVKIEQNEKLLKRQERFGAGTTITGTVNTTTAIKDPESTQATNTYAEKAKLRLERFKTTA